MRKIKPLLCTLGAFVLAAIVLFGVYGLFNKKEEKWEAERLERVEEVNAATDELKTVISEVAMKDIEEIQAFIEENAYVDEVILEEEPVLEEIIIYDPWTMEDESSEAVFDPYEDSDGTDLIFTEGGTLVNTEALLEMEEMVITDGTATENKDSVIEGSDSSDILIASDTAAESDTQAASDTATASDTVTTSDKWESSDKTENVDRVAQLGLMAVKEFANEASNSGTIVNDSDDPASDNDNTKGGDSGDSSAEDKEEHELTLKERQLLRSSSEETALWIEADKKTIEENTIDFSKMKVACLGDSVTEAANLLNEKDYEKYTYPTHLKEILNLNSIINLGIGGSSFGRFWFEPFCERYNQIPKDTDIIIVMGGYNDGYCMTRDLLGNIDEIADRTLYGDVNDLMEGLKENYPDSKVIFVTPMSNLLHDVLRKERDGLLPQTEVITCIQRMCKIYEFDLIDTYNQNFMDSHDAKIVSEYLPDSVHPNIEGYEVLARHIAAEIIRIFEKEEESSLMEGEKPDDEMSLSLEGGTYVNENSSVSPTPCESPNKEAEKSPTPSESPNKEAEKSPTPSESPKEEAEKSPSPSENPKENRNIIIER